MQLTLVTVAVAATAISASAIEARKDAKRAPDVAMPMQSGSPVVQAYQTFVPYPITFNLYNTNYNVVQANQWVQVFCGGCAYPTGPNIRPAAPQTNVVYQMVPTGTAARVGTAPVPTGTGSSSNGPVVPVAPYGNGTAVAGSFRNGTSGPGASGCPGAGCPVGVPMSPVAPAGGASGSSSCPGSNCGSGSTSGSSSCPGSSCSSGSTSGTGSSGSGSSPASGPSSASGGSGSGSSGNAGPVSNGAEKIGSTAAIVAAGSFAAFFL